MRDESELTAPATPTPWRIGSREDLYDAEGNELPGGGFVQSIVGAGGEPVCGTCDGCNNIKPADAERVCRAVNAHDALVEALEDTLKHIAVPRLLREKQWHEDGVALELRVRSALKLAKAAT